MLDILGIRMFEATDEQRQHVMDHLGQRLKGKVNGIYRVQNLATEERFDKWLETHGNPRVKEFWHGSRNENWISILQNGLLLNPNAQITGKMFGSGLYFAPSPSKSFNYTSYRGTTWAHGSSDTGVMGLYAVAYGEPHVVYDNRGFDYRFGWGDLQRMAPDKGCVHAKAGKVLRNDEVIFYCEDQTTINYLVDFK
jgi:poly [ADP-ribose] polymerase